MGQCRIGVAQVASSHQFAVLEVAVASRNLFPFDPGFAGFEAPRRRLTPRRHTAMINGQLGTFSLGQQELRLAISTAYKH